MEPHTARPGAANVSVFIMTRDEELNIRRCLDSVRWSDDVVVLDSYSQDRTPDLARSYPNVRLVQRVFDGYSSQRNHGLHELHYRNPWLLVLDADEVVEPALAAELLDIAGLQPAPPFDVYVLRRKVFLEGRCLTRNTTYDFWIERLLRPKAVCYVGAVHEKVRFDGAFGRLSGALEHHQFSKGVDNWLARRARYASIEARTAPTAGAAAPLLAGLVAGDTLQRRAALKVVFQRIPARWLIYLAYNLVFKLAFLDGARGLRYVLLETYSLYLSVAIRKESKRAGPS